MNLETNNKIQKKGITLVIPNPCGNIKETKMKNSGIEWIGEIPDEWESIRLKYIYSTTKAKLPKQFYDDKNLTPYLSMDFIRDSINTEPVYAKDGDYCSEEDILILWDGSNAGEIVFNHPAGYAPSTTAILKKLSTQSLPVYDKFYLKALEDELRRNTNGMGIPHVNGSYLNNSLFLLPPKSTQQRIATYLDKKCSKIEETIQNQQQVIEKLKAYKQSLITEAVTGKVKIENGKICGKYESYKDSGVEWIGKIPSEWETPKIQYIATISSGTTPNRSQPKYWNGDVNWIKTGELQNNRLFEVEEKITQTAVEECSLQILPLNSVLIAMYGQGKTRGMTALLKTPSTTNQACAALIVNSKKLSSDFLWHCLIGAYNAIRANAEGSGQPNLNSENIKKFHITLPSSIEEQECICNYLDKKCTVIDTAIEQKQKLIEKLTEYKKSLIYECVTGKKEI